MSLLSVYSVLHHWAGGSEVWLSCFGNSINWCLWFWIINALFLCADITGKPKWMLAYKVQPTQNVPVDKTRLWGAIREAVKFTVFSNFLGSYPVYLLQEYRGCSFQVEDTPSIPRAALEIAFFICVQETIFFYSHRALHHPYLYKHVHKKHHTWTAPIGLVAIYAHPVEQFFSNFLSVFAGPFLLGSHITVFWLWAPVMYTITISHHSGYHLPLLPSPEFHDYHHLKFNVNYGTWGPLDWLHGTDDKFRGTIQHKRNKYLLSLTPMSVQHPDKEPQNKQSNGNNGTSLNTKSKTKKHK